MTIASGLTRRSDRGIVVVDLVESVRHFERDEVGTAARWHAVVGEIERALAEFGGRLVKRLGGGFLLAFAPAGAAAACGAPASIVAERGGSSVLPWP
jgi:class 3 adenylate cyclase